MVPAISKVNKMEAALDILIRTELAQVIDKATNLRTTRPCRFLELPPELRNTIYRFAIDPQVVETHIRLVKSPALLRVNRQIAQEFSSIYYSTETMSAELYRGPEQGWKVHADRTMLKAMVARWIRCHTGETLETIASIRAKAEGLYS